MCEVYIYTVQTFAKVSDHPKMNSFSYKKNFFFGKVN